MLKIKNFNRGEGLFFVDKNRIVAKIKAGKFEYDVITTDRRDIEGRNRGC